MARTQLNHGENESGTNGAAGRMNKALLTKANAIRKLVVDAEDSDVLKRYKIACDLREVRDSSKYGDNAMKLLGEFLGWSEAKTGDYAALATTWPDAAKFKKLANQTGKHGIPLTWSHYIELMRKRTAIAVRA